jgi:hypothetical protein
MMNQEHPKTCEEKMAELLGRLDELLLERQRYQAALNAAENAEESEFAAKFIEINSKLLPALRKEIWDARNLPANSNQTRMRFEQLARKIDSVVNGVETQRVANISMAREQQLQTELSAAKTNSERRNIGRQLAQVRRDRQLAGKHQRAAISRRQIAIRKKQIYSAKKTSRILRKALRATA